MWLPVMMGGRLLLRPARRMKPLPILSMVTVMPASLAQRSTRSRPCLSKSVRVKRQTPPLGVAPIWASSMSEAHRRSPLMRRVSMLGAVAVVMWLPQNGCVTEQAGFRPGDRGTFFCFAQKKVPKEKASRRQGRCAVPCAARRLRGLAKLAVLKQRQP